MIRELDNCEICRGAKGGVRGNENIVDNILMCDYCSVEYQAQTRNPCVIEHKNGILHVFNYIVIVIALSGIGWILYSMYEIDSMKKAIKDQSYHEHRGLLLEWRNIADDQEIMYHWKGGVPNITDKSYFHDDGNQSIKTR